MAKAKSAAAPTSDAKASPPTSKTEPRARVRMYRQGLGDCLYVELLRGQQAPFRIMIDCGLVLGAKGATTTMQAVMADLVDTLGSASLDLLVVTHPHWDHVSGFLQAKDDFAKINADAVWLGWPEDPADPLAVKLSSIHAGAETALRASIDKLTALGLNENARQTQSLIDFLGAAPSAGGGTTRDAVKAAAA
jgi:glyoxylase-like metal-dependent hydrolase (beta-lactamase superfamily II)